MAALKPITAAALVAMLAFPADADVSGPVCVPDHQDTVYHPSMSAFTWFTAALDDRWKRCLFHAILSPWAIWQG